MPDPDAGVGPDIAELAQTLDAEIIDLAVSSSWTKITSSHTLEEALTTGILSQVRTNRAERSPPGSEQSARFCLSTEMSASGG